MYDVSVIFPPQFKRVRRASSQSEIKNSSGTGFPSSGRNLSDGRALFAAVVTVVATVVNKASVVSSSALEEENIIKLFNTFIFYSRKFSV